MKSKKLLVLALLPMFILTSCDKQIDKATAQKKAAAIIEAQETESVVYNTYKTTVSSTVTSGDTKAVQKYSLAVDYDNYYIAVEMSDGTSSTSEYYLVTDEGMVNAHLKADGTKTYEVVTTDSSKYKSTIASYSAQYQKVMNNSTNLDSSSVLTAIKNGEDLSGSLNKAFSYAGFAYTLSAEYSVKYFTTSDTGFGVSMGVSASMNGLYTASATSRIVWEDNLLSEVSVGCGFTVAGSVSALTITQKNKYNAKVNEININEFVQAA